MRGLYHYANVIINRNRPINNGTRFEHNVHERGTLSHRVSGIRRLNTTNRRHRLLNNVTKKETSDIRRNAT